MDGSELSQNKISSSSSADDGKIKISPIIRSESIKRDSDLNKIASSTPLTKREKSSFYPSKKSLEGPLEGNSSVNDSIIEEAKEDNEANRLKTLPEEMIYTKPLSKKDFNLKLSHQNIAEFYPYEEGKDDMEDNKVLKKRSLERVATATENQRYRDASHHFKTKTLHGQRKSQDAVFGSTIQKNALVNIENKGKPQVNALFKASVTDSEEGPVLGVGKNPRLKPVTPEDRLKRILKEEKIQLDISKLTENTDQK
uniref:Uncharacterized protein n=1 Tax=Euplotes crassus TaxID=5936 RepID=A0A7S3KA19_EUPCR|mmetsp:Transcript_13560/g.13485  ORF Transcript_13560/g.13485 Transcript_13560/m.13485 type:complete len:254 (+) Transcript_13560:1148-1909(+)